MLHWGSVLNLIITFSIPLRFHIVALCDFISFCHRKNIIDKTYPPYWKSYAKVPARDIKFQKQNRRSPYISRLLRFWYCLYTQVIPHLKAYSDIIVVTNSPKISLKLGEQRIKNYCTGGLLLFHSIAYIGSETEKFISHINADIFFFSSRGYTEDGFITDSSIEESCVKKAMLKNAAKSFYLCDSSKKNQKYMYNICATNEVTVITDTSV